jgi:uncharacterized protein YjbI with pentapeptide repeats/DNA-binding CsgD family transcriptional regulator
MTKPGAGRFNPTAREREVLDLIAAGFTNGQIAERLQLSPERVKWQVNELIATLEARSREEVADVWRRRRPGPSRYVRTLRVRLPHVPRAVKLAAGGVLGAALVTLIVLAYVTDDSSSGDGRPATRTATAAVVAAAPELVPAGCPTSAPTRVDARCRYTNYPAVAALNRGGCDFSGRNIDAALTGWQRYWAHADFSGCNLRGANFGSTRLGAMGTFAGADLREATFRGANLRATDFTGADLRGATLTGVLQAANFRRANLAGATVEVWGLDSITWQDTTCPDGQNSNENGFTCVGAGVVLVAAGNQPQIECPPGPQGITEGGVCPAIFYAIVTGTKDCDLAGADLTRLMLIKADLSGCRLTGADMRAAFLSYASLAGADATGADLRNATLPSADLSGAILRNADLRGTRLADANLRGADLTGALLLGGVDYNQFSREARWADTTCPDGSNSEAEDGDGFSCANNLEVTRAP